ncbi:ribosomal L7Ae/L30e/S12e/Gadd45 family protein [bacterium]|nr:ribosomal L7Ae/L30e/S12e/Gadd45 family protein [bacterium]MBU1072261.1 ribosomal L7Ae/L30e/S12e/Gadd45 family protein [bacterium]MBU1676057.1 ribosomal L7Ae/L30e/S12e/Gadd45 family protein [bacterium]
MTGGAGVDKSTLLKLLGLAHRAGRVACGFDAVAQLVARGRRPLVIVATDASPGQRDKILRLRPVREFWTDRLTRDELAPALGRKELIVVALADPDFLRGLGSGKSGKRPRKARGARRRPSDGK